MGFPTTLSMNLGMLVGWGILSPLAKHQGWAPGDVASSTDGARGWILWVALAIMISESLISLLPIVLSSLQVLLRSVHANKFPSNGGLFSRLTNAAHGSSSSLGHTATDDLDNRSTPYALSNPPSSDEDPEPPHRLVPNLWVVPGLAISSFSGIFVIHMLFGFEGIKPWASALGFVLASLLALLGVRALGETDLNPVSGIGKISQ
jgi:uncharacterized oligopeptide transporter (OPT) family protein